MENYSMKLPLSEHTEFHVEHRQRKKSHISVSGGICALLEEPGAKTMMKLIREQVFSDLWRCYRWTDWEESWVSPETQLAGQGRHAS